MKFIDETITGQVEGWLELLSAGDLKTYEHELFDSLMATYDLICDQLLPIASFRVVDELATQGKACGGRKIELRPLSLRIATGHQVEVESLYICQTGR